MTKRMLIDASHAEETRVVVLDGNRLEDFDVETASRKQLKGSIYLAKVVRVEPSLQAAFVEYGGNRHGFLAFSEIHPDYYQIPVADRQRLLRMQEEEARAEEEAEEAAEARARANHGPAAEEQPGLTVSEEQAALTEAEEPAGLPADAGADAGTDALGAEYAEPATPPVSPALAPAFNGGEAAGFAPAGDEASDAETPRPAAQPLQIAQATRAGAPENDEPGLPPDLGHDTAPEAAEAASTEAAETALRQFPAEEGEDAEAAPPPETVGGETGEEARERRTPRFMRNYKIQEVIRRRQVLLIQVVKEERGSKGAALTTYISLAGRYAVLMPNSPRGGGISRKITSAADRRRLKEITTELELPRGMGIIVRTAGANRPKPEIKRDCEYLLRLWDDIREHTMRSVAPALIYEEASLIKRAVRDVYSGDVEEILVDGEEGWRAARDFMRMLMPSHARKVQLWRDNGQSLFARHNVEAQLDAMMMPTAQLRSGGYLVINQTEALVAIDVNSGRSTRERGIEETALRTNLEAADEVARQLRLRDLAGLIVIDFIDMESRKHNAMVERRLKEALKDDRARIQVGQISHFGLMEMSRQRLRPSIGETSFTACAHCGGTGLVRSTESAALAVLRAIEEEGAKRRAAEILVHVAGTTALYILNHKRQRLSEIEARCAMRVGFATDDTLRPAETRIERLRAQIPSEVPVPVIAAPPPEPEVETIEAEEPAVEIEEEAPEAARAEPARAAPSGQRPAAAAPAANGGNGSAEASEEERRRKRRRRRRRGGRREETGAEAAPMPEGTEQPDIEPRFVVVTPEEAEPVALVPEPAEAVAEPAVPAEAPLAATPEAVLPIAAETVTETAEAIAPTPEEAPAPAELAPEAAEPKAAPKRGRARTTAAAPRARRSRKATAAVTETPAAPAEAEAAPAPEAVTAATPAPAPETEGEDAQARTKRSRRGGRRRREEMPAEEAPMPYVGPTPADPFAGSGFDLFEAIEMAEQQEALINRVAPETALETAPAAPAPAAPAPEAAAQAEAVAEASAEATAEEPAIKPVLVTGESAGEKKRGWWRR